MRILAIILMFPLFAFAGEGLPDQPFVTALATASLSVKPDGVRILINANGYGDTATAAFEKSVGQAERLVEAVRQAGIPVEQIVASDVSVNEETRYEAGEYKKLGYAAGRGMTIEVRELERVGPLLDALLKADVSQISEIERFVDNEDEILAAVQEHAFEKARLKAKRYAALGNRKLDELWWVGDRIEISRALATQYLGVSRSRAPIFSAGEMEFEQTVEVIYLLE